MEYAHCLHTACDRPGSSRHPAAAPPLCVTPTSLSRSLGRVKSSRRVRGRTPLPDPLPLWQALPSEAQAPPACAQASHAESVALPVAPSLPARSPVPAGRCSGGRPVCCCVVKHPTHAMHSRTPRVAANPQPEKLGKTQDPAHHMARYRAGLSCRSHFMDALVALDPSLSAQRIQIVFKG